MGMTYYEQLLAGGLVEILAPIRCVSLPPLAWPGAPPQMRYGKQIGEVGELRPGDKIEFLTVKPPKSDRPVRVRVHPHDGRDVGDEEKRVYILWPGSTQAAKHIFQIVPREANDLDVVEGADPEGAGDVDSAQENAHVGGGDDVGADQDDTDADEQAGQGGAQADDDGGEDDR